ncbi:MAG TPA: GNAT family N-acetyltransferase [Methanomicrobiales archaeon]|nr:GNAT family N-acetyltransferase [Methanomicrobiales archaeon]
MEEEPDVEVRVVTAWDTEEILSLYRSAGWWKEGRDDPSEIPGIIRGSLVFVIATEGETGRAVGMGRAISDGVSDAYIQDLAVLPAYRGRGIGRAILRRILGAIRERGIEWIALIAEGGTGDFYRGLGFEVEEGDIPMMYRGEEKDVLR